MELFDNHKEQFYNLIYKSNSYPLTAIDEGYKLIKDIAHYYYVDGKMNDRYSELLSLLRMLEISSLRYRNILEFHYELNPFVKPYGSILDYVIWHGRKCLINMENFEGRVDLYRWGFEGLCRVGSLKIKETCDNLGIKCDMLVIIPNQSGDKIISSEINYHAFNIIEYGSKRYLVDITLAQFFCSLDNHPGRLGVAEEEGPYVGFYMMKLPRGQEIARTLFTTGYIELDDEVFKTYMDAFTLSRRNGLYYEEGGVLLPYTVEQYYDFIESGDNQLNHEPLHCLGLQKRPLKNPNLTIFDQLSRL